jgi:ribosomal protein L24E
MLGSLAPVASAVSTVKPTIAPMCMASRETPERVEADNGHHVPTESDLVQASLIVGDTVYFTGPFTKVSDANNENSQPRQHLAACSLSTGEVLPWNPGTNGYTNWELAYDGERIYVGGEFTQIGGVARPGLAALDPTTGAVLPWTPASITGNAVLDLKPQPIANSRVEAIFIKGDTIYIGGTFNNVGGQARTGLAALDRRDGHVLPWNPKLIKGTEVQYNTVDIEVRDIVIWRDKLIACGFFSEDGIVGNPDENGNNRLGHIAAFDLVAGAPLPWETKPEYPVFGLAANSNWVYYTGAGKGPPRNDVSQLDPMTGKMNHRYATDGNVQSVWATEDTLYVVGHMNNVVPDEYAHLGQETSLHTIERLWSVDADTFELTGFAPKTDQIGDGTWHVTGDGDKLVIAGEFHSVEGQKHNGIAQFDLKDPFVSSVSPTNLAASGGDQVVTIKGANFAGTPTVSMGPGVTVKSVRVVSPSQLEVTVSAAGAAEGIRPVMVTDGAGGRGRCLSCFALGTAQVGPVTPESVVNKPPVGPSIQEGPGGYWLVASDGGIFAFGDAKFQGSTGNIKLAQPIVGMAQTKSGAGYWMVASDGGIFAFGDARFHGSTGNIKLAQPIVGMAPTATGNGYWLVARDGGIFAFGDAKFHGSTGNIKLAQPIVGMTPTLSGAGYWMVASDGGIFAFGDAKFQGSTGSLKLAQPIVGMSPTASGTGYWLLARDGGIFAFGDAKFLGSTGSLKLAKNIVAMTPTVSGSGYWLVAQDGGIFAFGDALFKGSTGDLKLTKPIVGMARP